MDINIDSIEYSIEQTVEICKSYSPGGVVLDNPQSSEGEAGRKSSPEILLQRDCSFDRNEIIVRSKKSSRSSCLSSEDRDSDVDIMSDSGGEPDVNFEENQFLTASEGETGGEDERSDGDCASRRSSIDDGCNVESLRRDAIEGSDGEESCSREANETASDDENEVTAMQIVDGDCQMKSQEDSEMNDEEEDGEMKADEDSKVNDEEENGEMKANEDSEMNDEQDKEDSEVKADEDSEINDEEEDCEMRDGGEDETHSMDCVEQASASSGLQGLQDEAEHSDQCSSTGELEIDDGGMSKESKHLASDGEGKSSGRDDSSQPDDSSHPDELLLSDESLKPERVTTPASPQKDNDSDCASSQHAPLEDFAHGSPTSSQSNHLPCGPTSPRDRSGERGSRLSPPRKSTNPLDPPITIETGVFAPTASSTSSSSSEHGDPLSPALDKELMKAGDANRRKQSEDRGRRVEAIRLVTQNGQKRIVAKSEATNATKQDFNG